MNEDLVKKTNSFQEKKPVKQWQWRPARRKAALIMLTIFLAVGSYIILIVTGDAVKEIGKEPDFVLVYNFNVVVFLLFIIWTSFTDKEWPVWKRLLWVLGLWVLHGFMQILPFSILVDRLTGGFVTNPTTVTILLAYVAMRRSSFFVEPVPAGESKERPIDEKELREEEPRFHGSEGQDDKIDLFALWDITWKRKNILFLISGFMVTMSAVSSLFLPNIYEAKAVIIPVQRERDMAAALMGNLSSIIGLPGSTQSSDLVLLLQSKLFREKTIQDYNLMPVLFKHQWDEEKNDWKRIKGVNTEGAKKVKTEDKFTLNSHSLFFIAVIPYLPDDKQAIKKDKEIPDIWDALRALEATIRIDNNIMDKTVVISAEADSPDGAANMANIFLTSLNDYMSNDAKRVAAINKKYLEDQLIRTADPLIKQKIYNLIAQQVEASMMAEVKENCFFRIIDPPKAPDIKIKPKRALMVMSSFLVSMFIGFIVILFLELWKKIEKRKNAAIKIRTIPDE